MSAWLPDALGLGEGESPFPWQWRLLTQFEQGQIPSVLDIPTGLGKTAVMAIWLVARAVNPMLPRRLVYVVDRRAVVDQATDVAIALRRLLDHQPTLRAKLGLPADRSLPISTLRGQHVDNREWLEDPSLPAIVIGTVDMVGSRLLFSGYGVSSKMRPYHAGLLGADALVVLDEAHLAPAFEELLRRVERGAEAFGPKDRSLGNPIPSFKVLSLSATGRHTGSTSLTLTEADRRNPVVSKRLNARKTLAVIELAGPPQADDADKRGRGANPSAEDNAKRKTGVTKLAGVLARQAWELTRQGADKVRCLVYCQERRDAAAVGEELRSLAEAAGVKDVIIELFVGGRRVRERTMVATWLVEHGFMEREDGTRAQPQGPTFLVATSAGEVGVDLDADHMACDLVAWERMIQRLGRVNRRGDGDAKVIVVVGSEPMPLTARERRAFDARNAANAARNELAELQKRLDAVRAQMTAAAEATELRKLVSQCQVRIRKFKDADARLIAGHEARVAQHNALRNLLKAVERAGGSLSPDALVQLRQQQDLSDALRAATTAEPLRPELTRAVVDTWSMTSLEEHPGRPDIGPWLHGFRPNDPPQTTVVWRRYLPVRADDKFDPKTAKGFFEAAPPHTSEQLETETHVVLDWLIARAEATIGEAIVAPQRVVAIAIGARGELRAWCLEQLACARSKEAKRAPEQPVSELEEFLTGATLFVDARLGGLADGLLHKKRSDTAQAADDGSTTWLLRPDAGGVPVTGFRVRELRAGGGDELDALSGTEPSNGWVPRYQFVTEDVDGEPLAVFVVDGWVGDAATEDERAEDVRPQGLDAHQRWAEACARRIARRLGLDQRYEDLLALAARLHDEGKRAPCWQRAFKAPMDGRPYAKTKGPIDFDILDGYRHELGSLPYVEAHARFKQLSADDQEFVLHLIAAHHGFARPVIATKGCDDAPPSLVDQRARAVALRFARLSRRCGPWGLAWWETLLRAADQIASRLMEQAAGTKPEEC